MRRCIPEKLYALDFSGSLGYKKGLAPTLWAVAKLSIVCKPTNPPSLALVFEYHVQVVLGKRQISEFLEYLSKQEWGTGATLTVRKLQIMNIDLEFFAELRYEFKGGVHRM